MTRRLQIHPDWTPQRISWRQSRHHHIRNATDEEMDHPRFADYVTYVNNQALSLQNAMTFTYWLQKSEDWTRRLMALPPTAQIKVSRGQWTLDYAERWRDS